MAAINLSDVQCAGTDALKLGHGESQHLRQHLDQFVNRTFAQFRIGGMRHFAGGPERCAEGPLGGQRQAVVGRFTVNEETAALGREVGNAGAGRIALLTAHNQNANAETGCAQSFGGGYLGGDDALGVGNSAAVEEVGVFTEGM